METRTGSPSAVSRSWPQLQVASLVIAAPRSWLHGTNPEVPAAVHRLSKEQARRIAVRAQLLDASRPTDLLETVEHLTLLQLDPTAAIAPAADLVAWTRLGSSYRPEQLRQALDERRLFELDALVRPMSDLGLLLAEAAEFPTYERTRNWLRDNDRSRRKSPHRAG